MKGSHLVGYTQATEEHSEHSQLTKLDTEGYKLCCSCEQKKRNYVLDQLQFSDVVFFFPMFFPQTVYC